MQKEKCNRDNLAVRSKLRKKRRFHQKYGLTYESASEVLTGEYWDAFIHAEIYLMEILGLSKISVNVDKSIHGLLKRRKKVKQQTNEQIDEIMLELVQLLKDAQEKKRTPNYIWDNNPKDFCKHFLKRWSINLPTPLEGFALSLRELAKGFLMVSAIILLTMKGNPSLTSRVDLSVCLIDPLRILVDYLIVERYIKANLFRTDIKGKMIYRKFRRYDLIVVVGLILLNLGAQKVFGYPHSYVWFTLLQGGIFYLLPVLALRSIITRHYQRLKSNSKYYDLLNKDRSGRLQDLV